MTAPASSTNQSAIRETRRCRRCCRRLRVPDQIARLGLPVCHDCTRLHANEYARERDRRPCSDCGGPKPPGQGLRYCPACVERRSRPAPRYCQRCGGSVGPRRYSCDECQREIRAYNVRAWALANRDKTREASRRYYHRHPEVARAAFLRRYAALKADPAAWARYLEETRLNYRLKAEREGRPIPAVPAERYGGPNPKWTVSSPEPIRELARGWIASGGTLAELATASGVSERLLYRLLHEDAGLTVAAADRIVVALGLHLDVIDVAA